MHNFAFAHIITVKWIELFGRRIVESLRSYMNGQYHIIIMRAEAAFYGYFLVCDFYRYKHHYI